jgi:ABC-2 type transport system ATP-binding protein
VDPVSRRQFWVLIDDLAQKGVTVLVTTHYLDEAEHCGRIAMIQAGSLAALGTVSELKRIFADRRILEVRVGNPVQAMRALDAMAEVEKTSIFGTSVHAVLRQHADPAAVGSRLEGEGVSGASWALVEPSLEDVFLDVVQQPAVS